MTVKCVKTYKQIRVRVNKFFKGLMDNNSIIPDNLPELKPTVIKRIRYLIENI